MTPAWHPIAKTSPKVDSHGYSETVLVRIKTNEIFTAFYDFADDCYRCNCGSVKLAATHWRELVVG